MCDFHKFLGSQSLMCTLRSHFCAKQFFSFFCESVCMPFVFTVGLWYFTISFTCRLSHSPWFPPDVHQFTFPDASGLWHFCSCAAVILLTNMNPHWCPLCLWHWWMLWKATGWFFFFLPSLLHRLLHQMKVVTAVLLLKCKPEQLTFHPFY